METSLLGVEGYKWGRTISGQKTPLSAREGLVSLCFTFCQSWRGATGTHCFYPSLQRNTCPVDGCPRLRIEGVRRWRDGSP